MLTYTTLCALTHICLAIILLGMMMGLYKALAQMSIEVFSARVFLNRHLIKRTWIGIFIIITMLIAFQSIRFYGHYTASDVDLIGDAIMFGGAVLSILLITMWRKTLLLSQK